MKKVNVAVILAAFVVTLGLSSCLNNGEDTYGGTLIAKVESLIGFKTSDGYTIYPVQNASLTSVSDYPYALIYYKYTADQYAEKDKYIKAEVQPLMGIKSQPILPNANEVSNAPIVDLCESGFSGGYGVTLFNRNQIFIPISYMIDYTSSDKDEELKAELNAHQFYLYYKQEEITSDNKNLVFYVCHQVSNPDKNEERKYKTWLYYGFDMSSALREYQNVHDGDYPTKLIIKYEQNWDNGDYETGVSEKTYEFGYKQMVDTYFPINK